MVITEKNEGVREEHGLFIVEQYQQKASVGDHSVAVLGGGAIKERGELGYEPGSQAS